MADVATSLKASENQAYSIQLNPSDTVRIETNQSYVLTSMIQTTHNEAYDSVRDGGSLQVNPAYLPTTTTSSDAHIQETGNETHHYDIIDGGAGMSANHEIHQSNPLYATVSDIEVQEIQQDDDVMQFNTSYAATDLQVIPNEAYGAVDDGIEISPNLAYITVNRDQ